MEIISHVRDMQRWSDARRREGKRIAFVPTMGFLHEGHLSLVREGKRHGDVVVSIFVNPIQFNQQSDFDKYPKNFAQDRALLEEVGAAVLFYPAAAEMYPDGFQTFVEVEKVSQPLCGAFRPGHFRGVATVVTKLFNIVKPHVALFGEKDFQQCVVIQRMVKDLNFDLEILPMPTIREADGLAMSSRNARLSPEERRTSLCISRALNTAANMAAQGERRAEAILSAVRDILTQQGEVRLEYASLCHPESLVEVQEVAGPTLLAIAAWVGEVRLIDNRVIG
ncbi:MAG TPA: pantoate--beta-alanine ligase [Methylomirabilota bacterium]|jgi:pantoate--beta-alanine ligase|nr:pantoate--beta-alanine ligase [Methylomirabilota bacterium]